MMRFEADEEHCLNYNQMMMMVCFEADHQHRLHQMMMVCFEADHQHWPHQMIHFEAAQHCLHYNQMMMVCFEAFFGSWLHFEAMMQLFDVMMCY